MGIYNYLYLKNNYKMHIKNLKDFLEFIHKEDIGVIMIDMIDKIKNKKNNKPMQLFKLPF